MHKKKFSGLLFMLLATALLHSQKSELEKQEEMYRSLPNQAACRQVFEHTMKQYPHSLNKHIQAFARTAHKHNFSRRDIEIVINEAQYACEKIRANSLLKTAVEDKINTHKKTKKQSQQKECDNNESRWEKAKRITEDIAIYTEIAFLIAKILSKTPKNS